MKNLWIIANWKSNKTITEALDWLNIVGPKLPRQENLKIIICPTFSCLSELKKEIQVQSYPIFLGSQDLSPFGVGAYTGEEPAELLKELVSFSIVGHSERRFNFGENDGMVAKKITQAKDNGIVPFLCVQGKETPVPQNCGIIAYEPISAISTGLTNTPGVGRADNPHDANEVAKYFIEKYPEEDLKVIYGGSVNSQNIRGFISQENISGALIGGASLDPEEFLKIVENCGTV